MNEARHDNALMRAIKVAFKVESNELKATILSFLWVFLVMSAWYILRPVRRMVLGSRCEGVRAGREGPRRSRKVSGSNTTAPPWVGPSTAPADRLAPGCPIPAPRASR